MLAQAFLNKKPRDWNLCAVDWKEMDITQPDAVRKTIRAFQPVLILHCAAFTRVDDCEDDPARAFAVNGAGAGHVAQAASEIGAKMVHFSTDYIFDGTQATPYDEEAAVHPLSVYGESKLEGERQVRKYQPDALIVRTQWLYGKGGAHFVGTILKLAARPTPLRVVDDQTGSPTWTEDLSEATLALIEQGATGTFHCVNAGSCSWHTFACQILKEAGVTAPVLPCTTSAFPRPARRPAYSVLSTAKAQTVLGGPLPPWEVALRRFIRSV
jgi:dTDP-4-dehydrorhamnose reductase